MDRYYFNPTPDTIYWGKDGDMKAEDIGYIFRCLLNDYGYGFATYSDGEICKITVEVKDYEEFEMIKVLFDEAKYDCRR